MKISRVIPVIWLLLAVSPRIHAASLTVFPLFSDQGILQQEATVPIWGTASPGASISIHYRDTQATALADQQGKWVAHLQTPKAEPGKSEGYDLVIAAPGEQITLHDVALGEVWMGSGQSNIDTTMTQYPVGQSEIPKADVPGIRLYSGGGRKFTGDFSHLRWQRCSPETVGQASAAGYFFCRELHKALDVPVGFINMAVGGSPLTAWVMPEWLEKNPQMAAAFENFKTIDFPAFIEQRKERLAKWQAAVDAAKAKGEVPAQPWPPFPGPAEQPLENFIGQLHANHTATVMPFAFKGMIWDQGESNVGYGIRGNYDLIFEIMIQNLRKGFGYDLPVVYCQMPKGGGWGPTIQVVDKSNFPVPLHPQPLEDLPADAPSSGPLFEGFAKATDPFLRMNALPSCYMATTRDLQAALHPHDKDEYGARFCLVALNKVYGRATESFGPMMASAKRDGGEMRLSFDHTGTGLIALGDKPLQGLYVTDATGRSTWPACRIEGNQVLLGGPGIASAVTVSYAHTNGGRVLWANLFNREGLPAYPMTIRVNP